MRPHKCVLCVCFERRCGTGWRAVAGKPFGDVRHYAMLASLLWHPRFAQRLDSSHDASRSQNSAIHAMRSVYKDTKHYSLCGLNYSRKCRFVPSDRTTCRVLVRLLRQTRDDTCCHYSSYLHRRRY